jgi:hypothetical protein
MSSTSPPADPESPNPVDDSGIPDAPELTAAMALTVPAGLLASVAPAEAAAVAAARPHLEVLAAADHHGNVLDDVRDLLQAQGAYSEEAYCYGLDLVSREAVRRVKLMTLKVIAPIVHKMRQTKGWIRLLNPQTGVLYDDFDQWAEVSLGLSHTKATNLCTVVELVLPAAHDQGLTAADLEEIDESKLMLVAPLMKEHQRTVERLQREAELHHTPPEEVALPPTPDVAGILEQAKTASWQEVRAQVLTAQGVQKESVEITFLVGRLDDGRYEVHGRLTKAEMLRLDDRLRPRWMELRSQLPISLHDELREADGEGGEDGDS